MPAPSPTTASPTWDARSRRWTPCWRTTRTTPGSHELKGQVLFENGRVREAIAPYERAVALKADAALLRLGLARAQIELGDSASLSSAIENLEAATRLEKTVPQHWYQLGIARGRAGERAASSLAFAEGSLFYGATRNERTITQPSRQKTWPRGSAGWLRADDILNATKVAAGKRR